MEVIDLGWQILGLLFLVAVIAGLLDTLAGGGGLISMPALVLVGIPPLMALGTNKLQGSVGTATASFILFKSRRLNWQECRALMLSAFIGSAIGSVVVQFVNTQVLSFVIPVVLLFIGLYFLLAPGLTEQETEARVSEANYRRKVVPGIGFYDGMFGPGTGSFFSLAGVSLRGQGLIDATARAKSMNFATNVASLIIFLFAGQIAWIAGFIMMAGQMLGAWAGSLCLYRINPKYLRPIVVLMCFAMLSRYMMSIL